MRHGALIIDVVDKSGYYAETALMGTLAGGLVRTVASIADNLYLPDLPEVDLLIRTSGEARTSNFLPWQAAYAEYEFTETLWPDFTPEELGRLVARFGNCERRYGGVMSR